jgi:hypothetical protein
VVGVSGHGQPGDVRLLGGELVAYAQGPLADCLAGVGQLPTGPLDEALGPIVVNGSCAVRSRVRASPRRLYRRSHSP